MRTAALTAIMLTLLYPPSANGEMKPTPREGASYAVPLLGTLVRPWDAPENDPFAPGHRGIDIAAPASSLVRASADGVVSFAGSVAGNRTVSIDHQDGIRTSYSFLGTIEVTKGRSIALGEVVGTVGTGHPGAGLQPHVHVSARRSGAYLDPIVLYVGSSSADLLALVA